MIQKIQNCGAICSLEPGAGVPNEKKLVLKTV
jgi:hypothetical protein